MTEGSQGTDEVRTRDGGWVFPALLAVVLLVASVWALQSRPTASSGTASDTPAWTPTPRPTGETVRLEIDFGNGASQRYDALPWQAEMTVADLMRQASQFQPPITYSQYGEGAGGFLTAINGLQNEGPSDRNWLYRVDDRHAEVSFCLQKLEPGARVLWIFTHGE